MAESWPAPTHNSGAVSDEEYEWLHDHGRDGIFGTPAGQAPAHADGTGLHWKMRADRYGLVRGRTYSSGAGETITVDANPSGSTRYDLAVLRLDRSTWEVTAETRKGSPGSGLPALVRDAGSTGVYEVEVGEITVLAGASTIAAGQFRSRPLFTAAARRKCTSTTRPLNPLQGDEIYETDTGLTYVHTGSGWQVQQDTTTQVSVSLASGWSSSGGSNSVSRAGRMVELQLSVNRTGSSVELEEGIDNSTSGLLIATIPVGYRPADTRHFPCVFTRDVYGRIRVGTDGQIRLDKISENLGGDPSLTQCWTYLV